ncbi:coiled-coil domain-containing protein [Brachionus plicatilis]|uniref:Coiled-coil domain-containing protein 181 n=1 Tax=Brachionus plicatilis TaxID=10195 RepID=A0A3M7Q2Y3_BRAPC|nr:coiled-coil domain-containing protein [Brachionus plicatilis]
MNGITRSNFGLNKSDLYAPHINSIKKFSNKIAMNQNQNLSDILRDEQTASPDPDLYLDGHNFGDEDLYDFSNVKPTLNLGASDDEEEDEINFDYGYGYDYERVIKERLKIANQEFSNEPVVDKERPTTVSFDNTVKAFDIPKDDPENEKKEIVVVPLNDTVEKKDPDAFMNKIKEAIQRYDEMNRHNELTNEYNDENDDVEEYFKMLSNHHANLVKNSTPSPPSRNSPEMDKSNLELISKIVDSKETDSETKFPSPIPQLSPQINSPELQKTEENNVLIEKDGKFELISADEYTALEKNKQILPHPPQRPKTSNNEFRKSKLLNDKVQRVSGSSDPKKNRAKSHSPVGKHLTPEYAKDYKSPYQATIRITKPVESAEARRKRLQEEEEKKKLNQEVFEAWVKMKERQLLEQRLKTDEKKSNRTVKNKITYENWLQKKREQVQREKDYQKRLEQVIMLDKRKSTHEERSKAFKEWISRKLREKNEMVRIEKLENKKWVSKRRRSRKQQRLSQALEMANTYGYSSSYLKAGF